MIGFIGKINLLDVNEIKSGNLCRPDDGRMAHSFIVPARMGQFFNRLLSYGIRKQPFATLGVIAPRPEQ
jgi:hypothetical protein